MSTPSCADLVEYFPLDALTPEMFALQDEISRLAVIVSFPSCSEEYYDKYKDYSKHLNQLKLACLRVPKIYEAALVSWRKYN